MVTNNKVLPDPPDNMDENFSTGNENVIMGTDSDSDEEGLALEGYEPLPLAPPDDIESNDSDNDSGLDSGEQEQQNDLPPIVRMDNVLEREVWSEPAPAAVDITMDSNKVNEVKKVMANVTLPLSSIPEWANNIPEDQWKQLLIKRLQDLQRNS